MGGGGEFRVIEKMVGEGIGLEGGATPGRGLRASCLPCINRHY